MKLGMSPNNDPSPRHGAGVASCHVVEFTFGVNSSDASDKLRRGGMGYESADNRKKCRVTRIPLARLLGRTFRFPICGSLQI